MLKKRSEVKEEFNKYYRPQMSESEPERMLFEKFCQKRFRPEKQYPVGRYFADLAFPEEKIIVEYDGRHHIDTIDKDAERHKRLIEMGWKVFRIMNLGRPQSIYVLINCWGSDMGDFLNMEEAMDKMVNEVVWHLKRINS